MGLGKDVTVKACLNTLRQHEAIDVTMQHFSDVQITPTYTHDPTKRSQQKATNLSIGSPKSNKHISPVKELANVLVDGAAVFHIKSKTAQLVKLNATTAIKRAL